MVPDVASRVQLVVKNPLANAGDTEKQVWSLGQEDPLEKRILQPGPVVLPGKSHGQRSLAGYSPQGRKESDTTEWTTTHSETLIFWINISWEYKLKHLNGNHFY